MKRFIIFFFLCCASTMPLAALRQIPFTDIRFLIPATGITGKEIYEEALSHESQKHYTKFYQILHERLEDAKQDGTWEKYLDYHQNSLFKQDGRFDEKNQAIFNDLLKERNQKLLALIDGELNTPIAKMIKNIAADENAELKEASRFLTKVLCKAIPLDDVFLKELYEILAVHQFYVANLMYKDWMDKKMLIKLMEIGLTVENTIEAELIVNLETFNKIAKLAVKYPRHPYTEQLKTLVDHQADYISKDYDRHYIGELGTRRRAALSDIEKKAGDIFMEHAKKKSAIVRGN